MWSNFMPSLFHGTDVVFSVPLSEYVSFSLDSVFSELECFMWAILRKPVSHSRPAISTFSVGYVP